MNKEISDYWLHQINSKLKGMGFQTFSDPGCLFEYAIVDNYKIIYNKIVNSLQLYKKIAYLPEYESTCRKEDLICSYGCELKSIDPCIDDIFNDIKFEEKMKNTDWTKYCLKSIFHQFDSEEYYLKVFSVKKVIPTGFAGFKELCFENEPFEGQNMQMGKQYLRCSLIGSLYKVVEIPSKFKERQMTLFDFI